MLLRSTNVLSDLSPENQAAQKSVSGDTPTAQSTCAVVWQRRKEHISPHPPPSQSWDQKAWLQALRFKFLMHIHQLIQSKFFPRIHAVHPRLQTRLALFILFICQMLKISRRKETILVGHCVDLFANSGGRHDPSMTSHFQFGKASQRSAKPSREKRSLNNSP
jgi:hypothetical protein